MKTKVVIAAMAMGLWGMGLPVSPSAMAVELDFNLSAPTSGTISYSGGSSALIGNNIEVDNVVGLLTPANANVTSLCVSCVLNFTSGSEMNAGGPTGSNQGWWSFGSGGTISITGGVQLQGGTDIALGSTLLTGSFNSAFVQDLGGPGFKVTFGSFSDTKDANLLSYYGLTPGAPFQGALTLLFASQNPGVGGAFTSMSVFSGNVVNAPAPVPLPAAAVLFGSGLLGLAGALRKSSIAPKIRSNRMLKKSTSGVLASFRGSTYRSVRLASSLAAALLDGLFEHPARCAPVIPDVLISAIQACPQSFSTAC